MAEELDPHLAVLHLKWQIERRRLLEFETPEALAAFKSLFPHISSSEKWEEIERNARELREKTERQWTEHQVEMCQEAAVEDVVDKFVELHFKGATRGEKSFFTDQISKEVIAPYGNYNYSVEEMVEMGLAGVRRNYRKRHLKHLSHSWTAIKGLGGLVVVLVIYSNLKTTFEVVVFSLLVLNYIHSSRFLSWILLQIGDANVAGYARYLVLSGRIKKGEGLASEHEVFWNLQKALRKSKIDYYVHYTCNTLVTLVVFWNIFLVLYASA